MTDNSTEAGIAKTTTQSNKNVQKQLTCAFTGFATASAKANFTFTGEEAS
jgi:hypothetical protein